MQNIILKPRLSEKAYAHSQALNLFVFSVPNAANKHTIASAVETQFGVTVTKVNIINNSGKDKRTFLGKRGKSVKGTRQDFKKAYVTLKEGDSIPIFEAQEEAEKQQEKIQETADKAVEKQAAKESKPTKGLSLKNVARRTGIRGNK